MTRPRQPGLTDNELDVMKVLWKEGPLKVAEILQRLERRPLPAYTSLLTLVQTMEKKGYLDHTQEGKAFVYSAILEEKNFLSAELVRIAQRLFDGRPASLVMNLVEDEQLSPADIEALRRVLQERA